MLFKVTVKNVPEHLTQEICQKLETNQLAQNTEIWFGNEVRGDWMPCFNEQNLFEAVSCMLKTLKTLKTLNSTLNIEFKI